MSRTPVEDLKGALLLIREQAQFIHEQMLDDAHAGPRYASCENPVCRQMQVKILSFYVPAACFICGADTLALAVDQHDPLCQRCVMDRTLKQLRQKMAVDSRDREQAGAPPLPHDESNTETRFE